MKPRYKETKLGPTAQKVLVLLLGGLALGLSGSPTQYFHILKTMRKDWERINKRALHNAIKNLYRSKLIYAKNNQDNTTTILLTDKGRTRALTYNIDEIGVPPMKRWDKKWRVVLFDIPERYKRARMALQTTLRKAGFHQYQKSVLIHPFECQREVDFIIEFFNLRPYVRLMIVDKIDNELDLKNKFGLS